MVEGVVVMFKQEERVRGGEGREEQEERRRRKGREGEEERKGEKRHCLPPFTICQRASHP